MFYIIVELEWLYVWPFNMISNADINYIKFASLVFFLFMEQKDKNINFLEFFQIDLFIETFNWSILKLIAIKWVRTFEDLKEEKWIDCMRR